MAGRFGASTPKQEFEEMYRENAPKVYSFVRGMLSSPADAEDVTGEVFWSAWRHFEDGRADEVTTSWLLTVGKRRVYDLYRRDEVRRRHDPRLDVQASVDPIEETFGDPNRERFEFVLSRMTDRHRLLLVEHYVHGRTVKEIAEMLEESADAVESAVRRAKDSFRRLDEASDSESTA